MSAGHAQLHARLAAQQLRIEHLERERDELESFSHALAHDLHSPLSAIDGFSVLLQESLEALPAGEPLRHLAARVRADASSDVSDIAGRFRRLHRAVLAVAWRDPIAIADLAVDGDDLRAAGIADGRAIGETLQRLLHLVLEDPARNRRRQAFLGAPAAIETNGPPAHGFRTLLLLRR